MVSRRASLPSVLRRGNSAPDGDGCAKEQLEEVENYFHWSHLVHTSVRVDPQMGARDDGAEFVRSPLFWRNRKFGFDSFD